MTMFLKIFQIYPKHSRALRSCQCLKIILLDNFNCVFIFFLILLSNLLTSNIQTCALGWLCFIVGVTFSSWLDYSFIITESLCKWIFQNLTEHNGKVWNEKKNTPVLWLPSVDFRMWGWCGCDICHHTDHQIWFGWSGWLGGVPFLLQVCSMCVPTEAAWLVEENDLPG